MPPASLPAMAVTMPGPMAARMSSSLLFSFFFGAASGVESALMAGVGLAASAGSSAMVGFVGGRVALDAERPRGVAFASEVCLMTIRPP